VTSSRGRARYLAFYAVNSIAIARYESRRSTRAKEKWGHWPLDAVHRIPAGAGLALGLLLEMSSLLTG
jgi:hypothetical protein